MFSKILEVNKFKKWLINKQNTIFLMVFCSFIALCCLIGFGIIVYNVKKPLNNYAWILFGFCIIFVFLGILTLCLKKHYLHQINKKLVLNDFYHELNSLDRSYFIEGLLNSEIDFLRIHQNLKSNQIFQKLKYVKNAYNFSLTFNKLNFVGSVSEFSEIEQNLEKPFKQNLKQLVLQFENIFSDYIILSKKEYLLNQKNLLYKNFLKFELDQLLILYKNEQTLFKLQTTFDLQAIKGFVEGTNLLIVQRHNVTYIRSLISDNFLNPKINDEFKPKEWKDQFFKRINLTKQFFENLYTIALVLKK